MKKLFVLGAILISFIIGGNMAMAADNPFLTAIRDNIIKKAQQDWGNDYEMVKYTVKKQIDAFKNVCALAQKYKNDKDRLDIITRAIVQWSTKPFISLEKSLIDWEMVEYTAKNQLEAYDQLKKGVF